MDRPKMNLCFGLGIEMASAHRTGAWRKAQTRSRVCMCVGADQNSSSAVGGGWIRRAAPLAGKPVNADSVEWSVPEMAVQPVNLLEEIVWWKGIETDMRKEKTPFLVLRNRVKLLGIDGDVARGAEFLQLLKRGDGENVRKIAEVRRHWPREDPPSSELDVMRIASDAVSNGSMAIAVQTDAKFYGGSLMDMNRIRISSDLPILCTELINQPYQFYEIRYHRADAAIVHAAVFSEKDMEYNLRIASTLGMALFVEVNSSAELAYALSFPELTAVLVCKRDLDTMRGGTVGIEKILADHAQELRTRQIVVLTEGTGEELASPLPKLVDAMIVSRD